MLPQVKARRGFLDACRYGDVHAVEAHLRDVSKRLSIREQAKQASRSCAVHAATEGGLGVLRILLKHGFNPNLRHDGEVPLITAIKKKIRHGTNTAWQRYDALDILDALVEAKAQVDLRDNRGRSALWWAAKQNHSEAVKRLLVLGADSNLADKTGCCPSQATSSTHVKGCLEGLSARDLVAWVEAKPPASRPLDSFFTQASVADLRHFHEDNEAPSRLKQRGIDVVDFPENAPIAVIRVRGALCVVQLSPLVVRGPTGETVCMEE